MYRSGVVIASERSISVPWWIVLLVVAFVYLVYSWHLWIAPWLIARRRSRWDMLAASRRASLGHLHIIDPDEYGYWDGDQWSNTFWDMEFDRRFGDDR